MDCKYKLVHTLTADQLEEELNRLFQDMWSLHGQTFVGPDGYYCQALTKKLAHFMPADSE